MFRTFHTVGFAAPPPLNECRASDYWPDAIFSIRSSSCATRLLRVTEKSASEAISNPTRTHPSAPFTLQGINPKINYKIILKECKKKFNCNGTIVDDPELGQIIQLQGDQRKNVAQFLVDEKIAKKDLIKIHGS